LSKAGAALLADDGRAPDTWRKRNWTRDNTDATRLYIGHTLATADVRIALDLAVASRPTLTVRHDRDLAVALPRDYIKHPGRPFSMSVPMLQDGIRHDLVVDCDAACVLLDHATQRRGNFLIEIDMDTMPIVRHRRDGSVSLKGTSMMRKFVAYERAHALQLEKTLFGWSNFYVLVITTTETHARNMAEAVRSLNGGKGSRLFRFASRDASAGDILAHPFFDCDGRTRTLLE
jgi:hypothetical protein